MDDLTKVLIKLRYILLPTLIVVFASIIFYLFIWWLVYVKYDLYESDNDLAMIIIPVVLSFCVEFIFIKNKWVKLLITGEYKFMHLFSIISIGYMIAGCYYGREDLVTYFKDFVEVERVEDIKQPEKFNDYIIRDFNIDGNYTVFWVDYEYDNTHRLPSDDMSLIHNYAAPFILNDKDDIKIYWFCMEYESNWFDKSVLEEIKVRYREKTDNLFNTYLTFPDSTENNPKRGRRGLENLKSTCFRVIRYNKDKYLKEICFKTFLKDFSVFKDNNVDLEDEKLVLLTLSDFPDGEKCYNNPVQYSWVFIFHLIIIVFVPLDIDGYDDFKKKEGVWAKKKNK